MGDTFQENPVNVGALFQWEMGGDRFQGFPDLQKIRECRGKIRECGGKIRKRFVIVTIMETRGIVL